MKRIYSHLLTGLFILLMSSPYTLFGADTPYVIKGLVVDSEEVPIVGATVVVKGTQVGAITNLDGLFTIEVLGDHSHIVVSNIGYESTEIPIGSRSFFDIVLKSESQLVDEIVVVAYGSQSKATITGALSTINTEELVKAPVASLSNVLAGSMPGVSTVQVSGQPGADDAAIFIRGAGALNDAASSPLILVDGIERSFSQLDPNEIESLSVLKDAASTAVFGVRGANGVILVTTKRGKIGKPTISISTNTGIQQPMSYAEKAGSYHHALFWNTKQRNDGIIDEKLYFTREAIENYRLGTDPIMYPDVDWADTIFNDVFIQTKNNINISGGTDRARYFVSFGYLYQNGVLKQFDFLPYNNNYKHNRYNFRANIDFKLTNSTNMKLNMGGVLGQSQEPKTTEGIDWGWTSVHVWALPMVGPGIVNGKRTMLPRGFVPGVESRDGFYIFYGNGYDQHNNTTINLDTEITQDLSVLTDGLSLSVKGGFDSKYNLNKYRSGGYVEYQRVYYQSYLDDSTMPETSLDYDKTHVYVPDGQNLPLRYYEDYSKDRNWYLEGRLDYKRSFSGHNVSGLLLYNQSRNYYPTNTYKYIPRSYVGFVGRATYNYQNKYMFDVSVGYNGSENFAPGKTRYGLFPSVSGGWVVSDEPFLKDNSVISYLKLRASWGKVGSDVGSSSRFMYMPAVWSQDGSYSFGINNPIGSEGFKIGKMGNSEVTWETATKQNYGIDLSVLDDRLTINADYFFEHRTGILLTPQKIPNILAMDLPALNLGIIDNQGCELMIGWRESRKEFSYHASANLTFARNKIIYMDEIPNDYSYQNITGGSTGRTSNVYEFDRLYQYDDFTMGKDGEYILNPSLPQPGVIVYPGDAMYADLNNDNVVDEKDRRVAGYPNRPELVFGVNAGFDYKGFNFSMQWTGATMVNRAMEIDYRIPFTNAGSRGLLQYFYDDCWSPENQSGTLPRAAEKSEAWNSEMSTLWLRDATYFRLKTLVLGYTFKSQKLKSSIGAESINVSLSGYNLLTFSPFDIMDPESLASNTGEYPLVKVYSIGVNVNF